MAKILSPSSNLDSVAFSHLELKKWAQFRAGKRFGILIFRFVGFGGNLLSRTSAMLREIDEPSGEALPVEFKSSEMRDSEEFALQKKYNQKKKAKERNNINAPCIFCGGGRV